MKIAILSVAILALIQTLLGIAVSVCRRKFRISSGCPDDPKHLLFRVRTAFSNCAEWHPVFMALLLVQPMRGGPSWAVWLGPAVVAARCLMIVGLVTFPLHKPNMFRVLGAGSTYFCALVLSLLLLFS